MAYDERLADQIRQVVARRRHITEQRMFGGLTFLVRGNVFCGIVGDELMARVGTAEYEASLKRRHARPMDFTGRPLQGYVYIAAAGVRTSKALRAWIDRALDYTRTLPAK